MCPEFPLHHHPLIPLLTWDVDVHHQLPAPKQSQQQAQCLMKLWIYLWKETFWFISQRRVGESGLWSTTVYFSLNIHLELSLWSTFSFSHIFSSWCCLSFMPQCRHFGTLPCQQETQFQAIQVGKEASSTELSFTSLLWKRQRQWKKIILFTWYIQLIFETPTLIASLRWGHDCTIADIF